MIGQAAALGHRVMLFGRENQRGDIEFIGKHWTRLVVWQALLPQLASGRFRAIADGIGYNLAGAPTLSGPQPALEPLLAHKADQFVHFQHTATSAGNKFSTRVGRLATCSTTRMAYGKRFDLCDKLQVVPLR